MVNVRALGSAKARSSPQVANRISVHGLRRSTQPVERSAAAVVERIRVGAVFEQDLDRLRKSGLHYVVQRGCAVVALVDARPWRRSAATYAGSSLRLLLPVQLILTQSPESSPPGHPEPAPHRRKDPVFASSLPVMTFPQ